MLFEPEKHTERKTKGFTKVGFSSKSVILFSNLQKKIFQKNYPDLEILNFKFRIVFWNIFFFEIGRFKKLITLSEKSHH